MVMLYITLHINLDAPRYFDYPICSKILNITHLYVVVCRMCSCLAAYAHSKDHTGRNLHSNCF